MRSLPCLWLSGILHARISCGRVNVAISSINRIFHLPLKASVACWAPQVCAPEEAASSGRSLLPQGQAACSGCPPGCVPDQVT